MTQLFAITSDVAIPAATRMRTRGAFSMTCDALEVGQSFFAPGKNSKGIYASISPKKFPNKKFKVASIPAEGTEGTEGYTPAGVRVWRVQ